MSPNYDSKRIEPTNFLVQHKTPEKKSEELYDPETLKKAEFGHVWGSESHLRRRKMILKDHPEVAQLLIPTKPYSMILSVVLVTLNMTLAYLVKDASWTVLLLTVYILGGTINHTLHVLIHDFTHWGGHKNINVNKAFAIFSNIPFGIPSAISFGKYHSDHHNYLGEEGKDPDLPTDFEVSIGKGPIAKILFFIFLSPIYALRPFVLMHKKLSIGEVVNMVFIACTDILVYKFWGMQSLLYVLIGGYISIGAHPAAIHVIAEHAEFVQGLETFDYLGIWNFFNLNLGYHIEHHDFPTCPWYNLPKIRAAAPEFYERLPYHTSYGKVIWKFFFDDNFNLYNRTLRHPEQKSE